MTNLTLEQIEEGERLIESAKAGWEMPDGTKVTGGLGPVLASAWLQENAAALIASAKRVAQQEADEQDPFYRLRAAAAQQLGLDPTLPGPLTDQLVTVEPEVAAVHAALEAAQKERERLRDEQRRQAAPVVAALQAEAAQEFFGRPLVGRGQHVTNPHAINPQLIEAWYHSRGVVVRADIHPQDPKNVTIEPVKLIEGFDGQRRPRLQEQPDGHTMVWVR